ncbi:HlyD family secretion protein [Tepidibacter formicigenes]|jgi:HlyD family secretion protein|uniref:HlyD family secretion protein n=1 Tax=Tepidibacter formicigenes DSM 15518 TaxID=1123349 RepID=A0A1M6MNV0_9FIRM|nr:efflux RND transporter periplasmic adaptor subunit [Tepidibacter formicigenes]SHJ85127.1 HlyD family secretion protein [Tepidibacter formicigenes DSM 15518]
MKKKGIILISLLLMSSLLFGCSSTEEAKKDIKFQGIIEAQEVDLNSKIPGKIGDIKFEEGQEVKEGDVIAVIDSKELIAKKSQMEALVNAAKSQYEAAQSQVNAASSQLTKAQNGARTQEIAQAQAYYDLMVKTYDRVEKLYEKGAVSAQKKDEVKAQLDIAEQKLNMAKEGARSEDVSGAQAMVASAINMAEAARGKYEQAKAGLDEVNAYIQDTFIKSPIDGTITLINSDKGELVSTGMSIATVSDLSNIWIEINVDERKLNEVYEGQEAKITVPAFKDKVFKGKVVRINRKPDFAVKKATNDNGNYDIVSYGVKIKIENEEGLLRPGMTAFVDFIK